MKFVLRALKVGVASFGIALLLFMLTAFPIEIVLSKYFGEYEFTDQGLRRVLFSLYFLVAVPISVKYLR